MKEDCSFKIDIASEEEREIILNLQKLNSAYGVSYDDYSLNLVCSSTFDLAKSFSTLYNNTKILSEKDEKRKESLLAICMLVKKCLSNALTVLGIDVVDKM